MKCPFQKYESEYSGEKGQFMECYEKSCMAYRFEKELSGGAILEAGCRLIDEYVEHSTLFNNYNSL